MKEKIDFVITWVDGNDPDWQKEKAKYKGETLSNSNTANRYRDWGLLPYWFRSVEKYAPWVNKIYFVTCGQKPEWLDEKNPKLVLMDHKDFIPEEFLPTFNSSTIMMNLHRIPGLSERFVVFNDDVFLTDYVSERDFFDGDHVLEPAILSVISPEVSWDVFPHCQVNNLGMINQYFSKKKVLKNNWRTFYSLKYGKGLLKNLYLTPSSYFTGFKDAHLCSPYFKRYFEEVWEKEPALLAKGSVHKFRSKDDFTEWMVKYWQMCSGATMPRSTRWGRCYQLGMDEGYLDAIVNQKYKSICINDSYTDLFDFEKTQKALRDSFQKVLPEKSSYEI